MCIKKIYQLAFKSIRPFCQAHAGFIKQVCGWTVAKRFHSFIDIHSPVKHLQLLTVQPLKYVVTFQGAILKGKFLYFISVWEPIIWQMTKKHNHCCEWSVLQYDYDTWHALVLRVECKISYLKKTPGCLRSSCHCCLQPQPCHQHQNGRAKCCGWLLVATFQVYFAKICPYSCWIYETLHCPLREE